MFLPIFLLMSYVDKIKRIRKEQEKTRKLNRSVYLPERLITKKVYENNNFRVDVLCSRFPGIGWQISLNSLRKALEKNGYKGKLSKKILKYLSD